MSCISSNFSSFFLDSLNDPSEFAKYLSNGENKFSSFEDFQVFGAGSAASYGNTSQQQQYSTQQQQFNGSNSSCGTTVTQYYNSSSNNNNSSSSNSSGGSSSTNSNNSVGAAISAGVGHNNHNNSELFNNSIEASNFNQQQQQQQQQQQHHHPHLHASSQHHQQQQQYVGPLPPTNTSSNTNFHHNNQLPIPPHHPHAPHQPHPHHHTASQGYASPIQRWNSTSTQHPNVPTAGAQHFDGSFEFLKYLRHSNDYNTSGGGTTVNTTTTSSSSTNNLVEANDAASVAASSLIDLDTSTSLKPRSARKAAALLSSASRAVAAAAAMDTTLDVFDHDSKHNIFDLHHHITATNSSNSNESMDVSNLAFPSSHLNASNSNTSSEGAAACSSSDFSNLNASVGVSSANAPKPLVNFVLKENFDVHPSHKVEEGIFQHMNKLPSKKKENLKQLGVRFTGQMTLSDKSIVVENFIKFCQEYEITDHRPFLSLNQSGLNKPEQIKFARYLGQGLPSFTLFCIYSNFKNLFCTKRTEIYTKDGYNLPYILDKTKRFLSNTTADLKNISQQQSNDGLDFCPSNNNQNIANAELTKCNVIMPKVLENFTVYENFDVHETHRVEDGVCTHITRLPPKKQELLKQFGIQSNQSVTYYEKYIIIENFNQFCNEYKISDHRPFLDFHESGLPKSEQVKFVRYLGQGLPNLTLNKIYLAFRDILGLNRIEKITVDGYNLDAILKKKKKNLYNRMHATGIS